MIIGRIEGTTRVLGQSQGYLGLPIKDEVINSTVDGPETPAMLSAWFPTPAEMEAIAKGEPIYLRVLGTSHPPVMMFAAEPGVRADKGAIEEISAERRRQIEAEGFEPQHDDTHSDYELSRAAATYLRHAAANHASQHYAIIGAPDAWPWEYGWWKPKNPRRDLIRAAALIVAEIERLDRAEAAKSFNTGEDNGQS